MSDTDMPKGSNTEEPGPLSGVLGWAGIACVTGGVIVRFTMPAREQVWYWALMAGIVLILLYGVTQWRQIADTLGRRQTRYGALAGSSVLIALGILVAANFVMARQNKRWDLTAARQYSLAPQTIRLLESLDSPIRMMVFAQDIDFPRYRDRLEEYEYTSEYKYVLRQIRVSYQVRARRGLVRRRLLILLPPTFYLLPTTHPSAYYRLPMTKYLVLLSMAVCLRLATYHGLPAT